MKCRLIKRAIKSLVCGEKADAKAIQQHLSKCSRCAERYAHVLTVIRSAKPAPAPSVDADTWKQLSAQLHRRIRQEHSAPLGWWRSLVLSVGEWKLVRFRKAVAASVVALTLILSVIAFLNHLVPEPPEREVVKKPTTPADTILPGLPPDMEDVISIFGDGFITGVLDYGYIRPGDFYEGHELGVDSTIEALDFLFFPS